MCCFSQPAQVADTKIFARPFEADQQLLAYAMKAKISPGTSMVLPIPVPRGTSEGAVKFISLRDDGRANLFEDLEECFHRPDVARMAVAAGDDLEMAELVVHAVGDFVASFVPSVADFGRLDSRFRLPSTFWEARPAYADWGFAVFQLAPRSAPVRAPVAPPEARPPSTWSQIAGFLGFGRDVTRSPGMEAPVAPVVPGVFQHPMAFSFPTRDPETVFFPTVHLHDGEVHERANFDHVLYAQGIVQPERWRTAVERPKAQARRRYAPLLTDDERLYSMQLRGDQPNADVIVRRRA